MITALDFFNKNKNIKWSLKEIPSYLLTNVEKARWILNEAEVGWIELDLTIDVPAWKFEAESAFPFMVPHREDNNKGWNSCCIHGISVEKTGAWTKYDYSRENEVPYDWTDLSLKTPEIKKFWTEEFPAQQYRRIRFMELEPYASITPHSDAPGKLPGEGNVDMLEFGVPINIAVIHPTDCYMVVEGYGVVPFEEGKAFIVNIRNYHSVINFSDRNRIHVIGHSYGYGDKKEKFAELVVRSYEKMRRTANNE